MYGLSPLARGTRRRKISLHIPTQVYPRWRGEHAAAVRHLRTHGGLSPLARGTLSAGVLRCIRRRFIPAGAGNTWLSIFSRQDFAVYPRWRGEHRREELNNENQSGLSPLARGTLAR